MAFPTMPSDFPAAQLQAWMLEADYIDEAFRKRNAGQPAIESREFGSAANGVHYRWRALAEADEVLQATLPLGQPSIEHRYTEEAAVFSFFSSALTCAENLCYMCYAFAGMVDAVQFPQLQRDPTKVGPRFVRAEFVRLLPREPLTAAILALEGSPIYHTIRETRNVLSHRGSIPRQHHAIVDFKEHRKNYYIGGPLGDPPMWNGLTLDAMLASRLRADLLTVVAPVIESGLSYAKIKALPLKT
jgi:hypothetical protein